jgi:hypothetical protein
MLPQLEDQEAVEKALEFGGLGRAECQSPEGWPIGAGQKPCDLPRARGQFRLRKIRAQSEFVEQLQFEQGL